VRFLTWLLTTAIALATAAWLIDGIRFSGPSSGTAEIQEKLLPLLLVSLILGVISSFVKPVLTVLSIPFIIVTLGLFLLVINAAMLMLTGWLADTLDIGFEVTGFWPAVGGAIVITLVTWIVDGIIGRPDEKRR
jgi:putative membrane protein